MKKIIVTGGCGFIGREVVKKLMTKGYEVRVIDDLSKPESQNLTDAEFIRADLTDARNTERLFKGFDICINLAAKIGGIGYFHKYPANILSENNKIYSSTFEAAAKNNMERMVYISSSMVFENTSRFPSREEDVSTSPPPSSAYGFSKLIGEQYCRAFKDQFNLNYSICRPFNAYGIHEMPGEDIGYAHVIPDLIKKILNNQYPLEILGDGEQSRCFTYIGDLADGIVTVMESGKAVNEDFNISTSEETKVMDLAKKLWGLCEIPRPFRVKTVQGFTYDVRKRIPDTGKMQRMLGWHAQTKLDDGLKEVIEWLKKEIKK